MQKLPFRGLYCIPLRKCGFVGLYIQYIKCDLLNHSSVVVRPALQQTSFSMLVYILIHSGGLSEILWSQFSLCSHCLVWRKVPQSHDPSQILGFLFVFFYSKKSFLARVVFIEVDHTLTPWKKNINPFCQSQLHRGDTFIAYVIQGQLNSITLAGRLFSASLTFKNHFFSMHSFKPAAEFG